MLCEERIAIFEESWKVLYRNQSCCHIIRFDALSVFSKE